MIPHSNFSSFELTITSIWMLDIMNVALHIFSCLPTLSDLQFLDLRCGFCSLATPSSCSQISYWLTYTLFVTKQSFKGIAFTTLLTKKLLYREERVQMRNWKHHLIPCAVPWTLLRRKAKTNRTFWFCCLQHKEHLLKNLKL